MSDTVTGSLDWSTYASYPGYHISYARIDQVNLSQPSGGYANWIFEGDIVVYCDTPSGQVTASASSTGEQTNWSPWAQIGPITASCGGSGNHGIWAGFHPNAAGAVPGGATFSLGDVYLVLDNGPVDDSPPVAVPPPASDVPGSPSDSNKVPTCNKGAPINCATGNEWEQDRDLTVPGRGRGLMWARTYNSMFAGMPGVDGGNLAPGWSTSYSAHLDINQASGQVVVHADNGGTATFTPGGGGSFTAAAWVTSTLTANADGTYTYVLSDQTVESFDAAGVVRSVTDRNGYSTTLAYSGGLLRSATDPAGRSLTFSYTSGRLGRVTDPAGRSVSYAYDAAGNLASVTDVGGGVTHYAYDTASRLTSVTDPLGHATSTAYDAQGRAISQTDAAGATTTFAYESDPPVYNQTTVTDPDGRVTIDRFNGTLLDVQDAGGGHAAAHGLRLRLQPGRGGRRRSATRPARRPP